MRTRLFYPIISGLLWLCAPISVFAEPDAGSGVHADAALPAQHSEATNQAAGAANPPADTDWVRLGWGQMGNSNPEAALTIWQQGVNRLPPEQLLAFIGVYAHLSQASKQLKRIGLTEKAIILQAELKGKKAYYVMSAQDVPVDHTQRKEKLVSLHQVMHQSGIIFANAAEKFQTATTSASAPAAAAATTASAAAEKIPVVADAGKNQTPTRKFVDTASLATISSDWIAQGWQQFDRNNADAALAIWQQGVNSLPARQLLAFLGVYSHMSAAIRQLKRAGIAEKAIILYADFKGEKAYYVMSAADVPADKSIRREKLASLHHAINATATLYANAAGKFQTEMHVATVIAAAETFTIKAFHLIGNTLIADETFQKTLEAYTGENKTREDLVAAKQVILRLYRNAGYEMVAVGLPRQIKGGTIPVRVFEARIGKVWVTGGSKATGKAVKSAMSALKPGETANADMLDEQLREISRKRNVKSAQLVYHPTDTGVVDVEILVDEDNPIKIGLMASSLGTQETGQTLFTGIFYHNNLWSAGHKLTLSYTLSEKVKNLHLYSAMYNIPVETLDGNLILSVSRADVASGQVLGVLSTRGNGTLKSIHYEQTIFRTNSSRHYLDIGYEQHLFNERFRNIALPVAFSIGILARPAVLGYGYESNTDYGEFGLHASYYHNTPVGTQKRNAAYRLLNPAAFANWNFLRLSADYSYDWDNGWSFSGKAGGQISNNALIAGERFYITGLSKVRGFEEVEASGDTAFFLRTQVVSPNWLPDTRFHAFLDAGRYKLNFPFPGEFGSDKIVSTGLGAHWTPAFGLDVMAEAGIVLNSLPVAPNGSMTGHFKVVYWFQ